jgi:hypothetical protein
MLKLYGGLALGIDEEFTPEGNRVTQTQLRNEDGVWVNDGDPKVTYGHDSEGYGFSTGFVAGVRFDTGHAIQFDAAYRSLGDVDQLTLGVGVELDAVVKAAEKLLR